MLVGEFHNPVRQGCREQHAQAFAGWGHASKQKANVGDKAEIEHAICFVKYGNFKCFQIEDFLLEVIDQTPRCADQNVNAVGQLFALLFVVDAAVHDGCGQTGMFCQRFGILGNLDSQFAGGCNDQHAWLPDRTILRFVIKQTGKTAEQKCGSLASTGLCLCRDIIPGSDGG